MRKSLWMKGIGCAVVALAAAQGASAGSVIWDNGDWNPGEANANGYSHITTSGLDRRLLSDFSLSGGLYQLTGFTMDGVWTSGQTNLGTDIRLWIRADNGGTPGNVLVELNTVGYSESTTGGSAFGRPIVRNSTGITDTLASGNYWLEMQIQGPENYFQLTSSSTLQGAETWVNYSDFGGLQPASAIFGAQMEINWKLEGALVPAPGAMALLGLAGVVARRRRRN